MFTLKDEFTYIISWVHNFLGFPDDIRARNLLLGTMAHESHLGRDLHQHGFDMMSDNGAFGPAQHELKTHDDDWNIFIVKRPIIYHKMIELKGNLESKDALTGNLFYAVAMMRLHYARFRESLPQPDDLVAQAIYYRKYWNSSKGKGTVDKYVADYKRYVL